MKNILNRFRIFTILLFPSFLFAQLPAKMIQYPDISDAKICFTYGDDLWIADKTGGNAFRLTTTEGRETKGKFSPDGNTIAYNANYDGNNDIYTIPTHGGVPKRITTHGMSEDIKGWTKDGNNLIFTSSKESGKQRFSQAYIVSVDGGWPEKMPMEKIEEMDIHSDGNLVAMTNKSRLNRTWKRYRGGTAPDVFLLNLSTLKSENITNNDANDELPMWNGNNLYYLSDKDVNKKFNIWSYNLDTKKHNQITNLNDFEVRFPSIGNDEIVYEAGGKLYLLDLKSKKSKEIEIKVVGDFTTLKPRLEKVEKFASNIDISHDGKRIIVEARGDLFSIPKKDGFTQNISNSSGIAERYPSWSPNGKFIAYWTDKTGEYELNIKDLADNTVKQIGKEGAGFRYNTYWSPNSKMIVFVDQEMNIKLADLEKNKITTIDQENSLFEGGLRNFSVDWSSDSRYLTYTNTHENQNSQVCIYDTKESSKKHVTSAFYDDRNPIFSADDKFIYCVTNRGFSPIYSDYDNSWIYPNASKLAMIPLTKETSNPIEFKNDTVAIKHIEDKKEDKKEDEKEEEKKEEDQKNVEIDFEGLESRMIVLPIAIGNVGGIAAAENKIVYLKSPNSGSSEEKPILKYYDFESDEEKSILEGVEGFKLSADRKNLLVYVGSNAGIIEVAENQTLKDPINMSGMEMLINPKEEWRQIFTDVWRLERDFFYDKNIHGVDWLAMKNKYGALVDHAASRYDLNFIIGELIGEMNASHTYRGGGDYENADYKQAGYLGVDWKMEGEMYRIKEIVKAAAWDTEVKSPLTNPGVDVQNGDYIHEINGITLSKSYGPNEALQGKAGKTTEITVSKNGKIADAKKYLVSPLSDETRLRNLAWIEKNRKYVDEKSGGRIGYIYVPSTGMDGQEELVRMYYAQHHKDGLIIDERFNNGGQIPDRFVELLNRPLLAKFKVRTGKDWAWPPKGHYGPKAMLINGWSGSGGDAFPDYFRKRGLGPLIGSRTWGGLIGISGAPSLVDGGRVTVPTFRMYNPDGEWFEEGHGVNPDIEVPENPGNEAKGIDDQLDRSIEEVMKQLKVMDSQPKPKTPTSEDRSK
jgi:tricorn protease